MYIIALLCVLVVTPFQSNVLDFILEQEAGLNRHDVNGKTYAGITQQTWQMWRARQPDKHALPIDIESLAGSPIHVNPMKSQGARIDLIKRFYFDYFNEYNTWDVHHSLQLIYADMVVLSGHRAIYILQDLLAVDSDGVWGHQTDIAIRKLNRKLDSSVADQRRFFGLFDSRKRAFLQGLIDRHPMTYGHYRDVWFSRADIVTRYTTEWLDEQAKLSK